MIEDWLTAAEARCERASKGPWHHLPAIPNLVYGRHPTLPLIIQSVKRPLPSEADMAFIAAARSDLPRALSLLRKALEVVEAVRVYTTLRNYLTVEACRMDQDRLEKLVIEKLIRFDAAVKDEGGS